LFFPHESIIFSSWLLLQASVIFFPQSSFPEIFFLKKSKKKENKEKFCGKKEKLFHGFCVFPEYDLKRFH